MTPDLLSPQAYFSTPEPDTHTILPCDSWFPHQTGACACETPRSECCIGFSRKTAGTWWRDGGDIPYMPSRGRASYQFPLTVTRFRWGCSTWSWSRRGLPP